MAPPMKPSREEMLAVTMNQKLAKQGAKTRKLAESRDVNTMPDPKTYAAVMGLLGERPDEMGFSIAHPKYKEIMDVAEPAFVAGTAAQVLPLVKPAGQAVRGAAKALAPKAGQMAMKAAEATGMPVYGLGVVKNEGGNWLGGNLVGGIDRSIERLTPTNDLSANIKVMKARLESLKDSGASEREIRNLERDILENEKDQAVNNWVRSNLGKYGKNQMGTPSDPVRLLFEKRTQKVEAALAGAKERASNMRERAALEPDERRRANMMNNAAQIEAAAMNDYELAIEHIMHAGIRPESSAKELALERVAAGFPGKGMGESKAARNWEGTTDESIYTYNAGRIQQALKGMPIAQAAERALLDYEIELNKKFNDWLDTLNLTDKQEAAMAKMNIGERAALINDSKYAELVQDFNQKKMLINGPEWHYGQQNKWVEKLDPDTMLYAGNLGDLGFDHVIDILRADVREGRIRPDQLNKVTVEQAVQRAADYNLAQAKKNRQVDSKMSEGFPVHKEYPEGYRWIELTLPKLGTDLPPTHYVEQYDSPVLGKMHRVVNKETGMHREGFKTPERAIEDFQKSSAEERLADALKYEGDIMGHCVGTYCEDVVRGDSRIYSLRDPYGMSRATIEVKPVKPASKAELDWFNSQPEELQDKITQQALAAHESAKTTRTPQEDRFTWGQALSDAIRANSGELPAEIVQIKGSGKKDRSQRLRHAETGYPDNPDAHLLPYVQDFVKSGKWSEVRDLQNAGLQPDNVVLHPEALRRMREQGIDVPAYGTKDELTKLYNDYVNASRQPPANGMKAGGEVKMGVGGLLSKAAKAMKGAQEVLPAAEREENLRKFLETSKIKDRLYHITPEDITEFKPGGNNPKRSGPATWLTPEKEFQPAAHSISLTDEQNRTHPISGPKAKFRSGTNVMPVHAQAKSPMVLDDKDMLDWARASYAGGSNEFPYIMHPEWVKEISKDYDSILLADPLGRGDPHEVIMFEPKKIKSAIGNRGTYDVNEADVNKADGGEVKMGVGGLLKGAKAAQQAEKSKQAMKASEALGQHEGKNIYITQADRTKVGEGFLGGPGFSGLQHTSDPHREAMAAWGVKNPGTAKTILGGDMGKDPLFSTMIGSPTQHQSNQMVFDKMYRQFKAEAKKGNLSDELRFMINDKLAKAVDKEGKNIFPPDVDILGKNFHKMADTFDRRSIAGHLMGGVGVGGKKGQIIDYDKIIKQTTDPNLIDAPSGAIGNRLFTLSGEVIQRPDLHPAFPTIMTGKDMGLMYNPVPRELFMQDFINKVRAEKGRDPGYMDYTRGRPPSQFISEDWLTKLQKEGHKKGGLLKVKRKK